MTTRGTLGPAGAGRTFVDAHRVVLTIALVTAILAFLVVPSMRAPTAADPPHQRVMAVTVDHLPWDVPEDEPLGDAPRRMSALLGALAAAEAPTVGFVDVTALAGPNEDAARWRMVQIWAGAGFELGLHLDPSTSDAGRTLAVVERLQEVAARYGGTVRYLRPARHADASTLTESPAHLKRAVVVPFTVDNADDAFNQAYRRALERNDTVLAARLREHYLAHTGRRFLFAERLSVETLGRTVPQVLRVRANHLNADALGDLLERQKGRGYRFVTLDAVLADAAYERPAADGRALSRSWLHLWRFARGLPSRLADEPEVPAWLEDLAR